MVARSKKRHPVKVAALPASGKFSWQAVLVLVVALLALMLPLPKDQAAGLDIAAAWVGLAGLAGVAVLFARTRAREGAGISRAGLVWVLLLVWLGVCTAVSGRVWASLVGEPTSMMGLLVLAAATALGAAAAANAAEVRQLLEDYAWILVLAESLVAMGQRLINPDSFVAGTLSNSTYLGVALLLLLPWILGEKALRSEGERQLRLATGLVAVIALVVTGSRVAAVLAFGWFAWVLLKRGGLKAAARKWAVAALVLSLVVGGAVMLGGGSVSSLVSSLLGQRPEIYRQAVKAIEARPVVGWGTDGFWAGGAATSTVAEAEHSKMAVMGFGATDPHNLLLEVGVSGGLVALALFVWLIVEAAAPARARARAGADVHAPVLSLVLPALVLLTAPLVPHLVPLFAVIASAGLAAGNAAPRVMFPAGSARVARSASLAVLALASLVLFANSATRASFEGPSATTSPAIASRALSASRLWSADPYLSYLASLHSAWAASVDQSSSFARDRSDMTAIDHAFQVDSRNPLYALERARTIRFYGGSRNDVIAAFEDAFARYPFYPLARAEYAEYLARAGRTADAEKQLAIARLAKDSDQARLLAISTATSILAGKR